MRRLEVVAVSDDGDYVLLAGSEDATRPTHQVRIDGRLHAAVRGKLDDSGRRESELSPKEIQARLRAGEPAEQVAKRAKVPVSRVMRYAGPVISERERIIDQARATPMQRPRGPRQTVALGELVLTRLAATAGLHAESVAWTARRRDDGAWVVVLTYAARGGTRNASWLWQPAGRALTSLNALATRLGSEEAPAAPRRKRPAKRAPAKRAPVKRTSGTSTAAARKPAESAATGRKAGAAKTAQPAKTAAKSANGRVAVPSWSDVLLGVQAPAAARGRRQS